MSQYNLHRKPSVDPQDGWADASYELTWAAEELTPRKDLIVKIAPDAGYDDSAYDTDGNLILDPMTGEPAVQQHAAITFLEQGVIEINPNKNLPKELLADPGDIHAYQSRQDRKRYPKIWGAVIHEAAHANHSSWVLEYNTRIANNEIPAEQAPWAGAAMLLEESRIEKYQVRDRPQDQPWIEAAVIAVAAEEYVKAAEAVEQFKLENPQYNSDKLSRYKCGRAAALVLARLDSGSIFRTKDISKVEALVREAFRNDYDKLRAIWLEAHQTGDDDVDGMIALGKRWHELTGDSGDDQNVMGISVGTGASGNSDQMSDALGHAAEQAEKEASGAAEEEREAQRIAERRAASRNEAAQRDAATEQAAKTFGSAAGPPMNVGHPVRRYRNPTRDEVNRARETRIRLQNAYIPEVANVKVARELPPGRLSARSLQQRIAQRNAGMPATVPPFNYTDRKRTTTPPLKVGIIQDVSGSQSQAASAAVSGAWSLAKAANLIPDAKVAMVTFGNDVHCIIKPMTKIDRVPVINASAGTNYFLESLKALEGELELMRPGAARLVVILTDGQLNQTDLHGRDAALARLTQAGVRVLWIDTDGGPRYLPRKTPGLHVFDKASGNYDIIPSVICNEAVTALKK